MTVRLTKTAIDLGIVVKNGPAALAFYKDLLGFKHEGDMPMPGGGTMHRLLCGDSLIKIVVPDNTTMLEDKYITEACKGCVVVGGSRVTAEAIRKAIKVGATGVVTGGFDDKDLREFLGYDIGVAITGSEDLGVTLVVTEGFGDIVMAQKTFDLLNAKNGQMACINGATQIRAGVIRPEVVIPIPGDIHAKGNIREYEQQGLIIGSPIRVIRHPHFGKLGTVSALPSPLQVLESESKARVLEVMFEDGSKAIVPRANVELIES